MKNTQDSNDIRCQIYGRYYEERQRLLRITQVSTHNHRRRAFRARVPPILRGVRSVKRVIIGRTVSPSDVSNTLSSACRPCPNPLYNSSRWKDLSTSFSSMRLKILTAHWYPASYSPRRACLNPQRPPDSQARMFPTSLVSVATVLCFVDFQ